MITDRNCNYKIYLIALCCGLIKKRYFSWLFNSKLIITIVSNWIFPHIVRREIDIRDPWWFILTLARMVQDGRKDKR